MHLIVGLFIIIYKLLFSSLYKEVALVSLDADTIQLKAKQWITDFLSLNQKFVRSLKMFNYPIYACSSLPCS